MFIIISPILHPIVLRVPTINMDVFLINKSKILKVRVHMYSMNNSVYIQYQNAVEYFIVDCNKI